MSALVNLTYRYLTWAYSGGVIVGDDPPMPESRPGPRRKAG